MTPHAFGRREFLSAIGAGAAAGGSTARPDAATKRYDPSAKFDVTVKEVELRRNAAGRMLMARIYQPSAPPGTGPFPTVLDLHGGAWNTKDRRAEEPMDRALASSGVLVVAIDMTLAPEAPYPASVQDANYGVRWLKANARTWNGDASKVGIYGSSSGGHVAELLAMRPSDPRYNAIPLSGAIGDPGGSGPGSNNAGVAYVAMRSPVSNPVARFENARRLKRDAMMKNTTTYFVPWESIHESNPQEILERREKVTLPPLLVMQGALDDNVLPAIQEEFAAAYRQAGGDCRYELFEGCEHEWVATPGPQTDRAREMVKAFIAKHVNA
ncbi:MAG TPA: alpha/beta hydrolase [Vicinamibacterales bacterium]|nr:alpha/beta hydrolase [Vicinamibacterales bacterium]